jgi:pimeloyl-ACP methyl ester carboxylesterase
MAEDGTKLFLDAPVERLDTGTARLVYRRIGTGPPLLLVHGFPLSGFTWRKLLPELATRHSCYVPDLPASAGEKSA